MSFFPDARRFRVFSSVLSLQVLNFPLPRRGSKIRPTRVIANTCAKALIVR